MDGSEKKKRTNTRSPEKSNLHSREFFCLAGRSDGVPVPCAQVRPGTYSTIGMWTFTALSRERQSEQHSTRAIVAQQPRLKQSMRDLQMIGQLQEWES